MVKLIPSGAGCYQSDPDLRCHLMEPEQKNGYLDLESSGYPYFFLNNTDLYGYNLDIRLKIIPTKMFLMNNRMIRIYLYPDI